MQKLWDQNEAKEVSKGILAVLVFLKQLAETFIEEAGISELIDGFYAKIIEMDWFEPCY